MSIRILPYAAKAFDLGSDINDKLIPHLDDFLSRNSNLNLDEAENWRSFILLLLREYLMAELVSDYLLEQEESERKFLSWLSAEKPTVWSHGVDQAQLNENQEQKLIQSAKKKLETVFTNLPEVCKNLKFAESMLDSLQGQIFKKGKDLFLVSNEIDDPGFSAVIAMDVNGHYAGHVYYWENATEKNQCAMMGIRSSVENVLKRCAGKQIQNLAFFLLEGVRQRCMQKCKDLKDPTQCYISVKAPEGPMPFLLKQAGFRPYNYLTKKYEDIEIPKIATMFKYNFQSPLTSKPFFSVEKSR